MCEQCEQLKKKIGDLKDSLDWEDQHREGIQSSKDHVRNNWGALKKRGARFDPDRSMRNLDDQETRSLRRSKNFEDELAACEEGLRQKNNPEE